MYFVQEFLESLCAQAACMKTSTCQISVRICILPCIVPLRMICVPFSALRQSRACMPSEFIVFCLPLPLPMSDPHASVMPPAIRGLVTNCRELTSLTSSASVQVGFFAEAGPLQVFVSVHLIPDDFEYNQVDEPAFVSADEEVRIQQGTEVRLRVVGTRTDASEIVSTALLQPT